MRISKQSKEGIRHYANRVKVAARNLKFKEFAKKQFAGLIALAGIKGPNDESLRTWMAQSRRQQLRQIHRNEGRLTPNHPLRRRVEYR